MKRWLVNVTCKWRDSDNVISRKFYMLEYFNSGSFVGTDTRALHEAAEKCFRELPSVRGFVLHTASMVTEITPAAYEAVEIK